MSESPILQRYNELQGHLGLDLTELDYAFMTTPTTLQAAGELVAEADKAENIAKHVWEIVKAQTAERLRTDTPGISEARVTAMLPADPDVQEARQALDQAIFETKVCESLYRALDKQASLLTKAADMIISGYITPTSINAQRRAEIRAARTAHTPATDTEGRVLARAD